MPPALERIRAEAEAFREHSRDREKTASVWLRQAATIRQSVPSARVEDDGETIRLGGLSPGCAACKAGRWDCIFVTMRCNLDCAFCLRPRDLSHRPMWSAMGSDLATLCARYARAGISGVSFSGGEPFLDPEPVLEWISVLRRESPDLYLWAYTNGLTLSTSLLRRLSRAGLHELRFNVAATRYQDAFVTRMLCEAVDHIPAVAVEVPSIPRYTDLVLDSLPAWAEAGVKYLNLHELVCESGTNSESTDGGRVACVMPDGHRCAVDPASLEATRTVLARVAADDLPLAVNECSLRSKARQIRGRRSMLAPFVLRPYERLREDGQAECTCLFNADTVEFVHPASFSELRPLRPGRRAALMRRQLPLDLEHRGQWVHFGLIAENDGAL